MSYIGVIIEESLAQRGVLKELKVLETEIEPVTERMKTPQLKQWTLHTVEIPETKVTTISERLSKDLEQKWYADYKNGKYHYIIYKSKVFKVDLKNPVLYKEAKRYGISLGIPEHQVDFKPEGFPQ